MATFAHITAVGHLTADPLYIEATEGKQAFARLRVMHNPYGTKKDGTELDPIAINATYYGKLAETVGKYAKKGTQVLISGRLTENAPALDKDNKEVRTQKGQLVINMTIQGQDFTLLGSKADGEKAMAASTGGASVAVEEDVPF